MMLADPLLALAADILDDLERTRIANQNRLRQLTRVEADSDGEERGFGLDESHPDVARLAAMVDALRKLEHDAELNLARRMRAHPLGPWVNAQRGVGMKQAARLLAAIGDPYAKPDADGGWAPRRVSDLWSYCGHGDPARRRRIGMSKDEALAAGNQTAKMRVHLIAESIMKARGPLRAVYDSRRKATSVTHPDWTDGHSHNDALRVLAKEFLKALWHEASHIHEQLDGQHVGDTQRNAAVEPRTLHPTQRSSK